MVIEQSTQDKTLFDNNDMPKNPFSPSFPIVFPHAWFTSSKTQVSSAILSLPLFLSGVIRDC